jgi:L-aminoadipate-semialdehyde dehydrogenase
MTDTTPNPQEKLNRWKERLLNVTEFQLPLDYPRPVPSRYVEGVLDLPFTEAASIDLLTLSVANRVGTSSRKLPASPFILLLAGFSVLLHRYTSEEDIVVGSSSNSCNPLVLRIPIKGTDTFSQVVEAVHRVEAEAANDEVPLNELFDTLYPPVSRAERMPPPLFRVRFFNQMDTDASTLNQTATYVNDVTIFLRSTPSSNSLRSPYPRIEVSLSFNQVLFSGERMEIMLSQLQLVLQQAASSPPSTPVGLFSLISDHCNSVIPNPRQDLHWSGWNGAIPHVFVKNAHAHPDRVGIVETIASETPSGSPLRQVTRAFTEFLPSLVFETRSFTYDQLRKSATALASYFLSQGLQRGDVITLFAHRSSDLLVGVMGILLSGGVFNVIDPAYPVARQKIYLSVARPRAIVTLARAGELLPEVQAFVDAELELKTQIHSLQLEDDGTLIHTLDGKKTTMETPTEDLFIELGPDSYATLSFTSGSTGIPKGVLGRHFSLTHFYPWMAEQFSLSKNDRFTMLSGIAHDPIQRDIFTPLFLGAELRVPDPELIGTPGLLAHWLRENEVTVTTLTPAMGQLLSSNATSIIPSLRNAFFVGDVLTKRDCMRLQQIAPTTRIINMYGTTETQRAVSHFVVPPLAEQPSFLTSTKEILPAGKGMVDVQLLIVNRLADSTGYRQLCGIGEVGELFVRSSGLSEGYLGLPEASAEKFVKNWFGPDPIEEGVNLPFYKGARDRMYKSGDLGRYLPDGIVECVGRADDQVKIRGFRIELGEIDTHLSQHPRVRENVTLVRRDRNEEQTLVSYFVPLKSDVDSSSEEESKARSGSTSQKNYTKLCREIRDWLKLKLPSYSVPSVLVPILKMPLNPNGKIDKPALPFPDTAQFRKNPTTNPAPTGSLASFSEIEVQVYQLWNSLLPSYTSPNKTDNFFEVGGHSILATQMVFLVRKTFGVNVPLGIVFKHPTLQTLAAQIQAAKVSDYNLVSEDSSSTPLGSTADNASLLKEDDDYADTLYSKDYEELISKLEWPHKETDISSSYRKGTPSVYLLTGGTGFLGAFILTQLLRRTETSKVYCVVRSQKDQTPLQRLKSNALTYGLWEDSWTDKIVGLEGDLAKPLFGVDNGHWNELVREVDAIVHNGAVVHWVFPYQKLRAANVLGTLIALSLSWADPSAIKPLVFVSSTSVLDTPYYVELSDRSVEENLAVKGVREEDNLEGSRVGLRSGYAQSKWVSEKILFEARRRGYPVSIVRPGFIVGDSTTGATLPDDFLWRLVKGCLQIKSLPSIHNTVNMCPVDYVATVVVQLASAPFSSLPKNSLGVYHVSNPHRFRFNDLFQIVLQHGYPADSQEYVRWRNHLMDVTLASNDNALFPLLHFVLDDLPTSTKAPILSDTHTTDLLQRTHTVCPDIAPLIPKYLAYLVKIGFLPSPSPDLAKFTLPELSFQPNADLVNFHRSNRQ